jgi:hypothetical protein
MFIYEVTFTAGFYNSQRYLDLGQRETDIALHTNLIVETSFIPRLNIFALPAN